MSGVVIDPRLQPSRQAPRRAIEFHWSDPRFRNIVWQVLVISAVVLLLAYFVSNEQRNYAKRHIASGFGYLSGNTTIRVGESPIELDPSGTTYGLLLVVGILNTLKVAVVGVILATILGTTVGIARLSSNWLTSRVAAVFVEVVRDIPVLLQLLFWYILLSQLPLVRRALHPVEGVFLSNRGLTLPVLEWVQADWGVLGAFLAGLLGTVLWSGVVKRRQEATGVRPPVWPVALGMLIALPGLVWAALGMPFTLELPVLRGLNFQGGITLTPEYVALTVGLVIYTSSYIAEIVRSGILSVPSGQSEAAAALGIRPAVVLRQVVLPQALRVIIPPMTSQYLNLTKNSSLAVAIGFQDVVSIASTTLNQTGQSIEGIAIIMGVYLTISLSISLFMNWYNAKIALVER